MSVWRRTRMISFRVSESEFEALKVKSEAEGARSISDFARLALCGTRTTGGALDPMVLQLSGEIQELRTYVQRVTELLESRPFRAADGVAENGAGERSTANDMPAGKPARRLA